MKLIFCPKCRDIIKLDYEIKTCKCGECRGKYTNHRHAEVNGNGISIAISNLDLFRITSGIKDKVDLKCWARPHTGELNPHTSINKSI